MEHVETKTKATEELLQLVSFKIDKEEFAVDIYKVQEINKMIAITKVPNAPSFLEGVVKLRSRIIPVLSLRKIIGMESKKQDSETRIIIVDLDGKTIGLVVDEVKEVLRISKSVTEVAPDIVSGIDTDYITAIARLKDRLIILLDLEKILTKKELVEIN